MLTISDILNDDFEWDEVKIDDDEFEKLSTELIIDFLKKILRKTAISNIVHRQNCTFLY